MIAPRVCVVIPHYREALDAAERASLARCTAVLSAYPQVLLLPKSLSAAALLDEFPQLRVEAFDDTCLDSVRAYNRLMLLDDFYARFADWDYILIHQLDAFVFSDQLAAWCARGYDYLGAPWLRLAHREKPLTALRFGAKRRLYRAFDVRGEDGVSMHYAQTTLGVGNGGFSLRRVAAMRKALRIGASRLTPYLERRTLSHSEDAFFGIEVNRYRRHVSVPDYRTAAHFAWELAPSVAQSLTGGALPFGCHAWNKQYPEFWKPVFEGLGYDFNALVASTAP